VFQKFEIGETTHIVIDSSIHKGQPHPRYHGVTGRVIGMQGNAYIVAVKDGGKIKKIIVTSPHMRKCKA
jgi:large subunit ribosomal protein L21e